jgi:hypothetical protein
MEEKVDVRKKEVKTLFKIDKRRQKGRKRTIDDEDGVSGVENWPYSWSELKLDLKAAVTTGCGWFLVTDGDEASGDRR